MANCKYRTSIKLRNHCRKQYKAAAKINGYNKKKNFVATTKPSILMETKSKKILKTATLLSMYQNKNIEKTHEGSVLNGVQQENGKTKQKLAKIKSRNRETA